MTETSGPPARGCPGWMKTVLIVSLALNVAVAGIAAGMIHRIQQHADAAPRHAERILRFVPDDRRDDAKALLDDKRDDLQKIRADRRELIADVLAAIRAEPFSPDVLAQALRGWREASVKRREIVQAELVVLLNRFDQAERAHFAGRLEESLRRRAERRERTAERSAD